MRKYVVHLRVSRGGFHQDVSISRYANSQGQATIACLMTYPLTYKVKWVASYCVSLSRR